MAHSDFSLLVAIIASPMAVAAMMNCAGAGRRFAYLALLASLIYLCAPLASNLLAADETIASVVGFDAQEVIAFTSVHLHAIHIPSLLIAAPALLIPPAILASRQDIIRVLTPPALRLPSTRPAHVAAPLPLSRLRAPLAISALPNFLLARASCVPHGPPLSTGS